MTRTSVRTGWNTLIALVASALTLLILSHASRAGEVIWQTGWDAARAEAKATGKPLMVDFCTERSGDCQKLDAEVYPSASVVALSRRFVMLKLNAEREGAPQAAAYKVRTYPSVFFFSPSGRIIQYVSGYAPAPQFAEIMRRALINVVPPAAEQKAGATAVTAIPQDVAPAPQNSAPVSSTTQFAPSALSPQTREQILAMRRAAYDKNYSHTYVLDEGGSAILMDENGSYPVKTRAAKSKKKGSPKPTQTKATSAKKTMAKPAAMARKVASMSDAGY